MDIKLVVTLTKTLSHSTFDLNTVQMLIFWHWHLTNWQNVDSMLNWGVIPMLTEAPSSTDDIVWNCWTKQLKLVFVQSGDDIVIVRRCATWWSCSYKHNAYPYSTLIDNYIESLVGWSDREVFLLLVCADTILHAYFLFKDQNMYNK